MKKKILSLLLAVTMVLGVVCVLASCGGTPPDDDGDEGAHTCIDETYDNKCDICGKTMSGSGETCYHVDKTGDGLCDNCGEAMSASGSVDYAWTEQQNLLFQFTENDNKLELSSGCHRYLAGDDSNFVEDIDQAIDIRNAQAKQATNILVEYDYWPNTYGDNGYGWGECIEQIEAIVKSTTVKNAPDVYCNFIYDLVGASVNGFFANLKGTTRGSGALKGVNYFEFVSDPTFDKTAENSRGYMNSWMDSVTLSTQRTYVLGSDYFTDMIRAFFIIPVGIDMLETVGEDITGDLDDSGDFTIDDFYLQVFNGEWTYDLLMEYAEAVAEDDGNKTDTTDAWLGDEGIGFAMANGGVAHSGLLYTTSVQVINKEFNKAENKYNYYYPETNDGLYTWFDNAKDLLAAEGVIHVNDPQVYKGTAYAIDEWGATHLTAIRTRFSQGNILFGDIMMVGALEYNEYQTMREGKGFGVVPVPIYHSEGGDRYLTQIHNVARPGAIAYNTTKFAQCTAYLNYVSTNSTDILNTYYNDELMYNVAGGATGTVDMLKYIRNNVRTSFDKAMEDAMGVFDGQEAVDVKITYLVNLEDATASMETAYESVLSSKQGYLANLVDYFANAAD